MKNKEYKRGNGVQNVGRKVNIIKRCCIFCKNNFEIKSSLTSTKKFCSHKCYSENKIGKKHNWGDKIGNALRGKPKSKEHILAVIEARKKVIIIYPTGEKHFHWKGENALKGTKHDWIYAQLGRPQKCEHCGTTEKRKYHWANKSQEYKREVDDWMRLCVPCHSRYDRTHPKSNYNSN